MFRKSKIIQSLTALVLSALATTAVQAEVLVPLDQYLNTTTRRYETNQYKTSYTVYVPQLELRGNTIFINPFNVGEPVKLPVTKVNGSNYVDIESGAAMLGVSYTKNQDGITLSPGADTTDVKESYTLQTPLAWLSIRGLRKGGRRIEQNLIPVGGIISFHRAGLNYIVQVSNLA